MNDPAASPEQYSGPIHKVDRYLALAMRQLSLDVGEPDYEEAEEALTDEMDRLWMSMDPAEIVEVKHVIGNAVFNLTGKPGELPQPSPGASIQVEGRVYGENDDVD